MFNIICIREKVWPKMVKKALSVFSQKRKKELTAQLII